MTASMVTIERTSNAPYTVDYSYAEIRQIANEAKSVPREWINSAGNDIEQPLLDYLAPLILGESQVSYHNGLPEVRYITCVFGEYKGDKVIEKGTYAKMARGEMVRFLAERKAERPEEMKLFCRLGYRYSEKESTKDRYVFLKEQGGDK